MRLEDFVQGGSSNLPVELRRKVKKKKNKFPDLAMHSPAFSECCSHSVHDHFV